MIMVDVYVPVLDKEYDFCLNPDVKISTVIEEISEMIARKEHSQIAGNTEKMILCDREEGRILDGTKTLGVCRIQTGSRLMLV